MNQGTLLLPARKEIAGRCPNCGHRPKPYASAKLEGHCSTSCRDRTRPECSYDPCIELARELGLCSGHVQQQRRGEPLREVRQTRPREVYLVRNQDGHKQCLECFTWQDEDDFHARSDRADGLSPYCKECWAARDMLSKHNITMAVYRTMLAAQSGTCKICQEPPSSERGNRLYIDHNHACCPTNGRSCGRCIRGLLCGNCNSGIGMLREREDLFLRAAAYVAGTLT